MSFSEFITFVFTGKFSDTNHLSPAVQATANLIREAFKFAIAWGLTTFLTDVSHNKDVISLNYWETGGFAVLYMVLSYIWRYGHDSFLIKYVKLLADIAGQQVTQHGGNLPDIPSNTQIKRSQSPTQSPLERDIPRE
jgi:hypothetical protein